MTSSAPCSRKSTGRHRPSDSTRTGNLQSRFRVFIGGGKTQTGAVDIDNGSVTINLSRSTVDSNSLGLKGYQASGADNVDNRHRFHDPQRGGDSGRHQ